MIVKSKNPIRIVNVSIQSNDSFSYAIGDKIADKIAEKYGDGDDSVTKTQGTEAEKAAVYGAGKKTKTGFFSKQKREERKAVRVDKRETRRKKRIAKYGARPLIGMLKAGKKAFKDRLPKLKKKADGNYEKTLPDGKTVDVPKEAVTILPAPKDAPAGTPPLAVEKAELKTGGQIATEKVNGEVVVTNTYTENQTETATDNNGKEQVYKIADVVDEGSEEAKKPMSTLAKVGIGVGAAVILGVIVYLVVRPKK
tara:strand:- start:6786 stop:7544 length:759 start_codon:yes stop_codon:yes gene_type:complete